MGEEREPATAASVRDNEPSVSPAHHRNISTEPLDILYDRLAPDPVITKFLLAFSRWEYALKSSHRSRYVTYQEKPKYLKIDWREWATDHQSKWEKRCPAGMERWEILRRPPQFQCKVGDHLEARSRPPTLQTDLKSLAELVYAVRNNLFHGGKWGLRDAARDRDEKLLKECIAIILLFLEVDPELGDLFYDLGPVESRT